MDEKPQHWCPLITVTNLDLQCLPSRGCYFVNFVLCGRISYYQRYCPQYAFKGRLLQGATYICRRGISNIQPFLLKPSLWNGKVFDFSKPVDTFWQYVQPIGFQFDCSKILFSMKSLPFSFPFAFFPTLALAVQDGVCHKDF